VVQVIEAAQRSLTEDRPVLLDEITDPSRPGLIPVPRTPKPQRAARV
jgi:hypothetical protein